MWEEPGHAFGERRLRAFVDSVFDAYFDWNIQTGHNEWSGQMDVLLRLEPGSMPRTFDAWLERLHPEDRAQVHQQNLRVADQGGVYDGEYRLRRGDGTYIWVHDRGVVIVDDDGVSTHMVGAIRDITGERKAERAQREAADLYRTLFAQALNPAYHITEDGSFLDANDAGLAFLETTKARLLREDVGTLWGEDTVPQTVRAVLTGRQPVASLELHLQVRRSLKSLAVTLIPCVVGGQRTCFALGTDITEHETLRRALEASEELLRRQATALEDANTALRVILDQHNRDRADLERSIVSHAEEMIVPLLETLRRRLGSAPEVIYADAAIRNLRELANPLAAPLDALTSGEVRLSQREHEIANLIRAGKSSSEIAQALFVSLTTVAFHRKNLRRKLGLGPRSPSLAAYLARPLAPREEGHAASTGVVE
jgi:PAS domain-containing protein/DNA-binding CsgD family transcriptional regulator